MENYTKPTVELTTPSNETPEGKAGVAVAIGVAALYLAAGTVYATLLVVHDTLVYNKNIGVTNKK